nr:RNA-dependent RNA polymerase [Picobirnavirus sp.]
MPKSNVIKIDDYFNQSSQPNLRTYFGRVVKGQPEVYDTPFAKGETTSELLDAWKEVLESIDREWPTLVEFENDLRSKVGPLSVEVPLSERMDDIESYYTSILLDSEPIDRRAVLAVIDQWSAARGLRLRGVERTVEQMKKSTNSGSPYFTKRRNVVSDTIPFTLEHINEETTQRLPRFDGKCCAVLGWRGQEGGPSKDDVKQRVVWMFPFAINIGELRCYQPLIEAAQKFSIVPAWVSMDAVDRRITNLFDSKSNSDLIVCTDFSKFDQHFNSNMQLCAREVLNGIFTHDVAYTDWTENVFPIKYDIPLMYNYGLIRRGKHGMGSGSGGTNADETLAHSALQFEAAIRSGQRLNPNSQCLGDDGILTYPKITVEDVVKAYSSHGMEMNADKQYASPNDCVYLRRWHHKNYRVGGICVGVYSTYRALGRLRYLERYQDPEYWGPEAVALRQLSIIENVKYHPLANQFAEFCMKRDKYRLGIDIPGFLDNIEAKVVELMDHMPDFMGYTKTLQSEKDPSYGIKSWWIYRYLKSKS